MTAGQLMGFVRVTFGADDPHRIRRNCSVVSALCKKWGLEETERMVRGAQLLGWTDLISLNATEGIGRRWAIARYWDSQKTGGPSLETIGQMLRKAGFGR